LLDGEWHHVASVQDSNGIKLYVDGSLKSINSDTQSIVYDQYSGLQIGRDGFNDGSYDFNGLIDDLRIYNKPLNLTEIQQLAGVPVSVCGNSLLQEGEECDGSDFGTYGNGVGKCYDYNPYLSSGNLNCLSCKISTSSCTAGVCGDSKINPGEECDDGNTANGDGCSSSCYLESAARTIYADNSLASNCLNYNPSTRACSGGSSIAFKTLTAAANNATAGTTVLIKSGTYNEILRPAYSGTKNYPVTFKADGSVLITGVPGLSSLPAEENQDYQGDSIGIYLWKLNYITIDGLKFDNLVGWARIVYSNNTVFKNNRFTKATATGMRGAVKFVSSNYNQIINNTLYDGNDNLGFINSNYNLVVGNNISNGRHTLWTIKCGNYNVIRNNYLNNQEQKIGELLDCYDPEYGEDENVFDIFYKDAAHYNLIENNTFAYTAKDRLNDDDYPEGPFSGIQFSAQNQIVRGNVFYDNMGGAIGMGSYEGEAEYTYGNRVYNNVFYKNRFAGISVGGNDNFYDNIFKNNILYKNDFINWNDVYHTWGWTNAGGMPLQIIVKQEAQGYVFDTNNILNRTAGEDDLIAHQDDYEYGDPGDRSLAGWQSTHPANFKNNIQANPLFVNENTKDFHLQSGSPMIDAGAFLTKTASAGSGTSMQVEDVLYFYDGFRIEGEVGDLIQLDGQTTTARIVEIDYSTNTLTLSNSLTWTSGQGISLVYSGNKPDIGAYEYGGGALGSYSAEPSSIISQILDWLKGLFGI
jgi:cysteine-rich repeat protein